MKQLSENLLKDGQEDGEKEQETLASQEKAAESIKNCVFKTKNSELYSMASLEGI